MLIRYLKDNIDSETDHVVDNMPKQCPCCLAECDPRYDFHKPEWQFFKCGCAYTKTANEQFAHYHSCKHAYSIAVTLRDKICPNHEPITVVTNVENEQNAKQDCLPPNVLNVVSG